MKFKRIVVDGPVRLSQVVVGDNLVFSATGNINICVDNNANEIPDLASRSIKDLRSLITRIGELGSRLVGGVREDFLEYVRSAEERCKRGMPGSTGGFLVDALRVACDSGLPIEDIVRVETVPNLTGRTPKDLSLIVVNLHEKEDHLSGERKEKFLRCIRRAVTSFEKNDYNSTGTQLTYALEELASAGVPIKEVYSW